MMPFPNSTRESAYELDMIPMVTLKAKFFICYYFPHLSLNLISVNTVLVNLPCLEFDVDSCEEELWHVTDSELRNTAEYEILQGQFWNQQKMSLFIYHLIYQFYQLFLNGTLFGRKTLRLV